MSDRFSGPVVYLVLHHDEDRGDLVCEHVCVRRRREPLPGHGDHVQSLGQLVEEMRVSRLDLEPEGVPAVLEEPRDRLGLVREAKVHHRGQAVGLVEVEDLGMAVVGGTDEVEEDGEDGLQE